MSKDNTFSFSFECPFCQKETWLHFEGKEGEIVWDYVKRKENDFDVDLIQNELPFLKPRDRELFITGMCYECQGDIFKE